MLSGTSTQSPISSVLTMPTVMPSASIPPGSLSAGAMATSLSGALADSLFLGAMAGGELTGTGLDSRELLGLVSIHRSN